MLKKMMEKRNQKGFTLMEMLIVVAIIAILVAIAIPVFTSQLEKAREATDAANIRAAYAEVMMAYLDNDTANYTKQVKLQQKKAEWQTADIKNNGIAGLTTISGATSATSGQAGAIGTPSPNGTATVKVDAEGAVTITYA